MTKYKTIGFVAACVFALCYPFIVQSPFLQRLGALVLLSAISASAWNVLGGYAGQISFGHVIFFGCGAYSALVLFHEFQLPPIAGIPLGILASVLIALVIGIPTLRLSGHYFSMATIAIAELIRILVTNTDFLGGPIGLMGPATPRSTLDLIFRSAIPYYYIFLVALAITLFITWWIARHRFGYYLRAIRNSETAARSLGVNASRCKLVALLVSAALTSLAGSLYAIMYGFINPSSGFGIFISIQMVIVAALGGAGFIFGPLIGAIILVPVGEITNDLFGGGGEGVTFVLYGGIIIAISCFQPGGILALFKGHAGRRMQKAS